jgi:hypothetical protein
VSVLSSVCLLGVEFVGSCVTPNSRTHALTHSTSPSLPPSLANPLTHPGLTHCIHTPLHPPPLHQPSPFSPFCLECDVSCLVLTRVSITLHRIHASVRCDWWRCEVSPENSGRGPTRVSPTCLCCDNSALCVCVCVRVCVHWIFFLLSSYVHGSFVVIDCGSTNSGIDTGRAFAQHRFAATGTRSSYSSHTFSHRYQHVQSHEATTTAKGMSLTSVSPFPTLKRRRKKGLFLWGRAV